ncbi:hypothetical protein EDD16DRAFT_1702722 [Pisolithus croceorrhizus]|nr:hypothetical protein EDD16DRAFT_1702722 [Pisolithus croceorrhizus]KAI6167677.1 hypothetical protein EDD17DRAFT_1751068 [Pisolithus thermaeus]
MMYQTKKQGKHHNLSAILSKGLTYHTTQTAYDDDLWNQQCLLLFWLVHTINWEQELAGPMVMSYLMGRGDTYQSHHYTSIYWLSFVSALLVTFPLLSVEGSEDCIVTGNQHDAQGDHGVDRDTGETAGGSDTVTLDADGTGCIIAKCQVTDYVQCGEALSQLNVIKFFMNTYKHISEVDHGMNGWIMNRHILASKTSTGLSIARVTTPFQRLPKPESSDTWLSVFNSFIIHGTPEVQCILSGIQYLHHCQESAQMGSTLSHTFDDAGDAEHCMEDVASDERAVGIARTNTPNLMDESVSQLLAAQTPYAEQIHVIHALKAVIYASIFEDKLPSQCTPLTITADHTHRAGVDDVQNLLMWKEQMQGDVYEQNLLSDPGEHTHCQGTNALPMVDVIDEEVI